MAVSNIPIVGRSGNAPEPPVAEPKPKLDPPAPVEPAAASQPDSAKLISGNTARLRIDPQTERIIAEIVNEDNEVVKQVPPEELLELAATSRAIQGLLFDRNA